MVGSQKALYVLIQTGAFALFAFATAYFVTSIAFLYRGKTSSEVDQSGVAESLIAYYTALIGVAGFVYTAVTQKANTERDQRKATNATLAALHETLSVALRSHAQIFTDFSSFLRDLDGVYMVKYCELATYLDTWQHYYESSEVGAASGVVRAGAAGRAIAFLERTEITPQLSLYNVDNLLMRCRNEFALAVPEFDRIISDGLSLDWASYERLSSLKADLCLLREAWHRVALLLFGLDTGAAFEKETLKRWLQTCDDGIDLVRLDITTAAAAVDDLKLTRALEALSCFQPFYKQLGELQQQIRRHWFEDIHSSDVPAPAVPFEHISQMYRVSPGLDALPSACKWTRSNALTLHKATLASASSTCSPSQPACNEALAALDVYQPAVRACRSLYASVTDLSRSEIAGFLQSSSLSELAHLCETIHEVKFEFGAVEQRALNKAMFYELATKYRYFRCLVLKHP